ncbi:hypothetical protein BGZ63DRAFT_455139 [Mariannaea sp. PMI_226]|nr:hypothetical protein BGZ63DRAFT_455139 [Mariannaea sp. PMI_226]
MIYPRRYWHLKHRMTKPTERLQAIVVLFATVLINTTLGAAITPITTRPALPTLQATAKTPLFTPITLPSTPKTPLLTPVVPPSTPKTLPSTPKAPLFTPIIHPSTPKTPLFTPTTSPSPPETPLFTFATLSSTAISNSQSFITTTQAPSVTAPPESPPSTPIVVTTTTINPTNFVVTAVQLPTTITTPVVSSTSENGTLVPILLIPAAAIGAADLTVVTLFGGVIGSGLGLIGSIFGSLLVPAVIASLPGGISLLSPIVYTPPEPAPSEPSEPTKESHTSESHTSTDCDQATATNFFPEARAVSDSILEKRVFPKPDSDSPDDIDTFVLQQLGSAEKVPHRYSSNRIGMSSAVAKQLQGQPFNLAVTGLVGCTAVVVVSAFAVYMAHFFEAPSFQSQENFEADVLDFLTYGDNSDGMPSLWQLAHPDQTDAWFQPDSGPKAFIITPLERSGNQGLAYEDQAHQLANELQAMMPSAEITIVPYEIRFNSHDYLNTASGKVLFQYDNVESWESAEPDQGCDIIQFAGYQLWIENRQPVTGAWQALPFQETQFQKRQAVCSLHISEFHTDTASQIASTVSSGISQSIQPTTTKENSSAGEQTPTATSAAEQAPTTTTSAAEQTPTTTTSAAEQTPTTTTSAAEQTTLSTLTSTIRTPTNTQIVPIAQTVTTNGMVCVLVQGSNNPVCTPLETHAPNSSGTNVHISECGYINGSPRCPPEAGKISEVYQGFYNVMSNPSDQYGTVLILYGFDPSNKFDTNATATCQLQARWPSNYGDIYLKADGCLYDSQNMKIWDQCCSPPDPNNSGPVINPYRDPRPAAACNRTPGPFGFFIHFEIFIKGWTNNDPAELWKQVGGCGALTGKEFGTNSDIHIDGSDQNIGEFRSEYLMKFNLPITFKSGCVGRAIGSAGGPEGDLC